MMHLITPRESSSLHGVNYWKCTLLHTCEIDGQTVCLLWLLPVTHQHPGPDIDMKDKIKLFAHCMRSIMDHHHLTIEDYGASPLFLSFSLCISFAKKQSQPPLKTSPQRRDPPVPATATGRDVVGGSELANRRPDPLPAARRGRAPGRAAATLRHGASEPPAPLGWPWALTGFVTVSAGGILGIDPYPP